MYCQNIYAAHALVWKDSTKEPDRDWDTARKNVQDDYNYFKTTANNLNQFLDPVVPLSEFNGDDAAELYDRAFGCAENYANMEYQTHYDKVVMTAYQRYIDDLDYNLL